MTKLVELCEQHGLDPDDILEGKVPKRTSAPRSVSVKAMTAACSLIMDYFHPHFLRCHEYAYTPVHLKAAVDLTRTLVTKGLTTINARELRQYQYGKVHSALHGNRASETVNEVCDFLEARHIIRRIATTKTGRKPRDYEVNPLTATLAKRVLARR